MIIFKTYLSISMLLLMLGLPSCGSMQTISQENVNAKLARIKLGTTTAAEVETLFGRQDGKDSEVWFYNFSDTAVGLAATQSTGLSGMIPVVPTRTATNTKAHITFRFSQAGVVKGLEVARYFEMPFTTEYRFLVEKSTENILELAGQAGESAGFKVGILDKSAGTLSLEDIGSDARISIVLDQQALHLTSINPYDRQSNEYRVFTKRESAFAEKILASKVIQ